MARSSQRFGKVRLSLSSAVVVLAGLLAAPADAQPGKPPMLTAAGTTGGWSVDYDGFSHGLLVLKMHAGIAFTRTGYAAQLSFHTAGMIGWMVHNESDNDVQGRFEGDRAIPARFQSTGVLRGVPRVTRMRYTDGNPVIDMQTPPPEQERYPVPIASAARTIDTLSAIVMLIRQVGDDGSCEGQARLFDGRRLSSLEARTAGPEILPQTDRSRFAGQALRCDFTGQELAGFKKDESVAAQQKPRQGSAWLAAILPGEPPVPVRVVFDHPALGHVTLYLTAASAGPNAVAQNGALHG